MENNNQSNNQKKQEWFDERMGMLRPDQGWKPNAGRGLSRLRDRRERRSHRRRRSAALLTVSVVTGLGLMAFPAPRAFAERCIAACTSEGDNLHRAWVDFYHSPSLLRLHNELFRSLHRIFASVTEKADAKPELAGAIAPDFALTDAAGKTVRLSDYKGKVVLLNFWATWCPPCRDEIPWFVDFESKYRDRNFVVLGVSLDDDQWQSVKPFMQSKHVNYPVMIGSEQVAKLYGVKNLPETFIIDRSGRIALNCTGLIGKEEYQAEIEAALKRSVL